MSKITLQIISGSLKSRNIAITKNENLRPILSRVRATIFDILFNFISMENAEVLDICAGSGILGIEALSRNAKKAVFFDIDKKVCNELINNLNILNLADRSKVINGNIFFTKKNKEDAYNLVFLDLPYKSTFLAEKIIKKFLQNNWIDKKTLFVITMNFQEKFNIKDMFVIEKEKIISNTKILFLYLNEDYKFEENLSENESLD